MNKQPDDGGTETTILAANSDLDSLAWDKQDGLLPGIIQHAGNQQVLMLGYMNRQALQQTLDSGVVTFYSRSKQRLWTKGESSGNTLQLVEARADCDRDTLLIQAIPAGPTCHLGTASCFGADTPMHMLERLDALIASRVANKPIGSYTTTLLEAGLPRIAQKVGEEGVETALAAVTASDEDLSGEAADLLYHLLVLLRARGLSLDSALQVLRERHRTG